MKPSRLILVAILLAPCGCKKEATVATPIATPTTGSQPIKISGDDRFVQQIGSALSLLQVKDPDGFMIVKTYVSEIRHADRSGMWVYLDPPHMDLADPSAYYSITWCASVLVHDAYHSKLYQDYKSRHGLPVPEDAYGGVKGELLCNQRQLATLKAIGAPRHETDHVANGDGKHFDANGDGKYTWDDYEKQDW